LFTQVDPTYAQLTIQRGGGTRQQITDKSALLPEGEYTLRGTAGEEYEDNEQRVQVRSGQDTRASVILNRKARPQQPAQPVAPPPEPPPSEPPAVTSLFDAKPETWARNGQGFYIHQKTVYLHDVHFSHDFDVLRIGKRIGHEKISWRTYLDADDLDNYLEFELADKELIVREVRPGKTTEVLRKPHGLSAGQEGFYHIGLTVAADGVSYQIGQAQDRLPYKIEGRTAFVDKFGLRVTR
jgi:hypothetical protein